MNALKSLFTTKKDTLKNSTYENTSQYFPEDCWAKVVKVSDGDTIVIAFYVNKKIVRTKVRLDGIDAPELHSKNVEEIEKACKARDRLIELTSRGELVYIKFSKKLEKFGRLLADVYTDKKSIKSFNDILLEEGLVRAYDGGKKEKW